MYYLCNTGVGVLLTKHNYKYTLANFPDMMSVLHDGHTSGDMTLYELTNSPELSHGHMMPIFVSLAYFA